MSKYGLPCYRSHDEVDFMINSKPNEKRVDIDKT